MVLITLCTIKGGKQRNLLLKYSWDEWVPEERVMPITSETQALQQDLIKQVKENKQKAAPIQKITDPSTIKENKRRRDSLMDKEGSYLKKPEVKISVPESLKSQLVQDWENITKNQKVIFDFYKVDFFTSRNSSYQNT
jgi:mortality factor 4-like protein 1